MYIGIGPENGLRIYDRDAFGYACERCLSGDKEEKEMFMNLSEKNEDIESFARELIEWFFSGDWIYDEKDNKRTGYIIHFSDKTLRSFFGTYKEAFESAKKEADERELGFRVV